MRALAFLMLLLFTLAACDGGEALHIDKPTPLRYFGPDTDVLARAEPGSMATVELNATALDLARLLDSLQLGPADLMPMYAGAGDLTGEMVHAQVVLATRLGAGTLRERATDMTRSAGTVYGSALLFANAGGGTLAVHGSNLLLAPTEAEARAMIDRYGSSLTLADDLDVTRLVRRLDQAPVGVVAREAGTLLSALLGDSLQTPMAFALPVSHAALRIPPQALAPDADVRATLWLQPSADASPEGLVTLLELARGLAAASPDLDPAARAMLSAMTIRTDAPDVRLDLDLSYAFLTSLFPAR